MTTIQAVEVIGIDLDLRNGRPYLVGTTVTVADVAIARGYHGQDAEGVADWYGLSLPQVYAALAYYYAHKSEIDEQIRTQIRRIAKGTARWRPRFDSTLMKICLSR